MATPHATPSANAVPNVYPSAATRSALLALYDAKLARWPVAFEELDVPTRYGSTHVVASGDPSNDPLVLVHPAGCPAFVWRALVGPLSARYRTYALDTMGDVGKSTLADPTRHPRSGVEYSGWMSDVVAELRAERARVLAWSMGGWIALNFAADRPELVRRLAVLAPMGLPSWPVTLRVLFRLMTASARPSAKRTEELIAWAVGDDPAVRAEIGDWMRAVMEAHVKPQLGRPYPISGAKLAAIAAPTLVILGGRDGPIGDAEAAAARARKYIAHSEVEILPSNTHGLGVEAAVRIAAKLLAFFEEH